MSTTPGTTPSLATLSMAPQPGTTQAGRPLVPSAREERFFLVLSFFTTSRFGAHPGRPPHRIPGDSNFSNCPRQRRHSDEISALHSEWLHFIPHNSRQVLALCSGDWFRPVPRPRRPVTPGGCGPCINARTAPSPVSRKAPSNSACRCRGRFGGSFQRAHFCGALRH